ncbi:MAG: ATP-dependent RNA helicase HrpA [Planctomycetaceae bacterium]|nr:ATP-dependent RNA helicase HrpA [Planctomycetaceae bacterium]
MPDSVPALKELLDRLQAAMPADRRELRARIGGLEKRFREKGVADPRALAVVEDALARSIAERERRKGLVPAVSYPPELPVTAALDALREAISAHQVVVVAGETGSGKSTQLPKLCLELGRGVAGQIAHTQPRRIAARSVARRVAEELGVRLGGAVGVKVRFGDESGRDTLVKVMTDGMLLAETRNDPRLDRYDTIIVDEAHERSLNIDFLLGYLRRLLPRRPDLKIILTSATIDVDRLAAHFGACPVVTVSGREHPIDIRYRPPEVRDLDEEDPRMLELVARAVDEIDASFAEAHASSRAVPARPDVLVFLSGEREIREVEAHLKGKFEGSGDRGTEIVPLFARQGLEEQERVFSPGPKRRIVLATNVAETSLTVPRIHAVVDPGFARIVRYSARARVQRLPVEAISQASARQRAGRAGRLGPGVAIRLYSEENHAARPAFTPPEILRTNLASVILQMEALNLGKAEDFPFVDPPSGRALADGRATLVELGASTAEGRLTKIGRAMSLLPLDPRLSRELLASIDERCLGDALVVVAALAVQDPRIRPQEERASADLAHARFREPLSDFVSFLRLWRVWRAETKDLGSSARRRWCEKNYLSHMRMREWADTVQQLRELVEEHFKIRAGETSEEPDQNALHRAVLTGFASHIGARNDAAKAERGEYRGHSGALFQIHPSSALSRRTPNWIVAAEIVETTKRFARICARVQPEWLVRVAPHLCTRSCFEPHFVDETGQVAAWERTAFGELVLVPKRRVPFGPIDAAGARNVFIQEGLVQGRARTEGAFLAQNRALRDELEAEEARGRRRGLLLEDDAAFAFYDARVPAEIHSTPSFERWRADVERRDPRLLVMQESDLLREGAARADAAAFPREARLDELAVPLDYRHDPVDHADGVTARVPVEALTLVDASRFEWLVPGMLPEKVEALVRSLPKPLRVRLFPIEEVVQGAVEALEFGRGSLKAQLARHLSLVAQCEIRAVDFRDDLLAPHLSMRFSVVDADGKELGNGRDLAALAQRFATVARDRLRASIDPTTDPVARLERDRVDELPDAPIPREVVYSRAGISLRGHPALVVERDAPGERIALRVLDRADRAEAAHRAAVASIVAREQREAVEHHLAYDPLCEELVARAADWGVDDALGAVARLVAMQSVAEAGDAPRDAAFAESGDAPRDAASLLALVRRSAPTLHDRVAVVVRTLSAILGEALELERRLRGTRDGAGRAAVASRFHTILRRGSLDLLAACDRDELAHRLRLLQMLRERTSRLAEDPARDQRHDAELAPLREQVAEALADPRCGVAPRRAIERMMDEIEISRFAPRLPRQFPASERRLEAMLEELRAR